LWTEFGNLTEIWFDGGYEGTMRQALLAVLAAHQPAVVGFNAGGLISNAARWVGTEGDMPLADYPDGVWSTYCCNSSRDEPCVVAHSTACSLNTGPYGGAGCPVPDSQGDGCDLYYPAALDYTLQADDVWFWEPGRALRPLSELIDVYHRSVGRNTVMELDFAIDRRGKVDPAHKALYAQFGSWISTCYGSPVATAAMDFRNKTSPFSLVVDTGAVGVDRFRCDCRQTRARTP
jgi:hypothetical protein